jgi:hypothetical protein
MDMTSGWLGLDWGNVPNWFGATITSGSLMVAATSYRRSVRDKEREQAAKIAAWVSAVKVDGTEHGIISVRNSSDGPVFVLRVSIVGIPVVDVPELPQNETIAKELELWPILSPQPQTASLIGIRVPIGPVPFELAVDFTLERTPITTGTLVHVVESMQFRDSVGRVWLRKASKLKRVRNRRRYKYDNLGLTLRSEVMGFPILYARRRLRRRQTDSEDNTPS